MRSPFPGMDPWLESQWLEVHQRLVTSCADQLQGRLPDTLRARLEERVYVEAQGEVRRKIGPDVRVVERRPGGRSSSAPTEPQEGVAVAEPILLRYDDEPLTEGIIQILDVASGRRVITVIEFVSPTNKLAGEGRRLYLKKRRECFEGGVNYVEIDLTRGVDRYESFLPFAAAPEMHETYLAWVHRACDRNLFEIYPVSLRRPLPALRIPLRESDQDIPLELQPLIDLCYRNGRFDDLDYTTDPPKPLPPEDAAWADELLRAAQLR